MIKKSPEKLKVELTTASFSKINKPVTRETYNAITES